MKILLIFTFVVAAYSSNYFPSKLPAFPLAVKSPYLSTWIRSGKTLYGNWPTFWNGNINAMAGLVRVDGVTYEFMGYPTAHEIGTKKQVVQNAATYTATQTIFNMQAGGVQLDVVFLTPIEPHDLKIMSIPASYISLKAKSLDGKSHQVQVYIDITSEWIANKKNEKAVWSLDKLENKLGVFNVELETQKIFQEDNDQAIWGRHKFFSLISDATYQSGDADVLRKQFVSQGKLLNTENNHYRNIDNGWPSFAFAKDLGSVNNNYTNEVVYGIAYVRYPAIQISTKSLNALWQKYFHDEDSLITFFYNNYNTALTNAKKFDGEIKSKAVKVGGEDYAKIVQAATRQAYGGTELVIGPTGEPWLMLKEISSDGNCQTADVIYPHFPIQYYLNPYYIKLLIEPLLFEQESGLFPRKYAMHDLGSSYPRCIGHPSGTEESMEVEESGNMIILAAAYVKAAKDNDFAKKHYKILRQWADYLVEKGLFPGDALTTDDFLGRIKNATNLSLKAIVGLAAMGQLATAANIQSDVTYFNNISKNYSQTWVKYSQDSTKKHTKLGYGMNGSWSMLYNLYPDKLLGTNVIPQSVIDEMDNWYPQVQQKYGVPLLSDKNNKPSHMAKADWTMFQAAVSNTNVKTLLIHLLAKWLDETTSTAPFSDWQDVTTGGSPGFLNRPVIGGVYAPMTLN